MCSAVIRGIVPNGANCEHNNDHAQGDRYEQHDDMFRAVQQNVFFILFVNVAYLYRIGGA